MSQSSQVVNVPSDLWPIAELFFNGLGGEINLSDESEIGIAIRGVILLYFTIFGLAILTYKLGFARKLPILKSVVIYLVLGFGCIFLTIPLGLTLPIAEGLLGAAIVLGTYRYRLHQERKDRGEKNQEG